MKPRAFLFDAYGTLFDVHSVVLRGGQGVFGDINGLSKLWRQKQLEYTWLRSLMGRYMDFWEITEAALLSAAAQLQIHLSDAERDALMNAYLAPTAFPDVRTALEPLRSLAPLAILSNGSPRMLEAMVAHNAFESYFTAVISADRVKIYKPSPRVYALGPETLGIPASEILFVSSNVWDAAGAKAFGYRVCWCNRSSSPPDPLDFAPDLTVKSLEEIPAVV